MARDSRGQTSPLLLIALFATGGFALWSLNPPDGPEAASDSCDAAPCLAVAETGIEPPRLGSEAVCNGSGYLCAQLAESVDFQVSRWPLDRPPLRVEIVLPEHEDDPARARALLRAAVRGIQAWQGKPLPLSIVDRPGASGGAPDIKVTWSAQLDGSALGVTKTRWETTDQGPTYTSVVVVLATRSPYNRRFEVSPEDVELVAAHEMGHALGLPHSNSGKDLMFPTNTASRLSAQDYRTMEALYNLPNGVTISAGQTASGGR